MKTEFIAFYEEHKELYEKLELSLKELSKNKREINIKHLFKELEKLLIYVNNLLNKHFNEEEKIFKELTVSEDLIELFKKILRDHEEIREKYNKLNLEFTAQKNKDNHETTTLQKTYYFQPTT